MNGSTRMRFWFPIALAAFVFLLASSARAEDRGGWVKHAINDRSPFEAAGAFDIDRDGALDVLCGARWYRGPDFQESYPVREVEQVGTYYNCFATLPIDANADGRMDYVTCSYFGRDIGWVENPGEPGAPWTYHRIDQPGPSEAAWKLDLTGDGEPDFLPNTVNTVVFYSLAETAAEPRWHKTEVGTEGAGHGVGTGDVNGDGRIDLLTPQGWYEAPEDPMAEPWTWHPEWNLVNGESGKDARAGIQILARDLDGDGRSEVVHGMGHNYGLYWIRQEGANGSERRWSEPMAIDETIHQAHTLLWADLNADGREELVTGTRIYGHEVEPGDTDAPTIATYDFDPEAGRWERMLIAKGEPARDAPPPDRASERNALEDFPRGTAGTGLQMTAIDLDDDGDLDLLCPGKSGLYWFENPVRP